VGVCGATIDTIQARNLMRAAGGASHSDHGRDGFHLKRLPRQGRRLPFEMLPNRARLLPI
jgi:hypothetical protein